MYTHTFNGLSAGNIDELINLFGEECHSWDKVRGYAMVNFSSEEEADLFIAHHVFEE